MTDEDTKIKARERGCSLILLLIFGPLLILFLKFWVPHIIRKATTEFIPAEHSPLTGTYLSNQRTPHPTQDGKLIIKPFKIDQDENHYVMMEYLADKNSDKIQILFAIEELQQSLMHKQDKKFGYNSSLRAIKFFNPSGKSITFHQGCRFIGKRYIFGGALKWRYNLTDECSRSGSPVLLKGEAHGSFKVFCISLEIITPTQTYEINHRSQDSNCLREVYPSTVSE